MTKNQTIEWLKDNLELSVPTTKFNQTTCFEEATKSLREFCTKNKGQAIAIKWYAAAGPIGQEHETWNTVKQSIIQSVKEGLI